MPVERVFRTQSESLVTPDDRVEIRYRFSDKVSKGRQQRGADAGGAKLTDDDVIDIRRARESGESVLSIAKRSSVHWRHIYRIINRERWA